MLRRTHIVALRKPMINKITKPGRSTLGRFWSTPIERTSIARKCSGEMRTSTASRCLGTTRSRGWLMNYGKPEAVHRDRRTRTGSTPHTNCGLARRGWGSDSAADQRIPPASRLPPSVRLSISASGQTLSTCWAEGIQTLGGIPIAMAQDVAETRLTSSSALKPATRPMPQRRAATMEPMPCWSATSYAGTNFKFGLSSSSSRAWVWPTKTERLPARPSRLTPKYRRCLRFGDGIGARSGQHGDAEHAGAEQAQVKSQYAPAPAKGRSASQCLGGLTCGRDGMTKYITRLEKNMQVTTSLRTRRSSAWTCLRAVPGSICPQRSPPQLPACPASRQPCSRDRQRC